MKILIVGAGLSGICLAHELENHEVSFRIIDRNLNHSTRVAGGMINPMTFRRILISWRAEELISTLESFYPKIEEKTGERFFFPIKMRRVFSSENERKMWQEKLTEDTYSQQISPINQNEDTPIYIKDNFGNAFVNTPGYIESKIFIDSNHKYFRDKGKLIYDAFDYEKVDIENKTYKGERFTHLIFAEGFQGEDNPFFGYLPFKNVKGETLTIKSSVINKDEILNRKCFLLPTKDGNFKLGSTYTWGTKDPSPTEEAKDELIENYLSLSTAAMEVLNHEAGIRPATMDRRPMIGEHPDHKGLYIFNGLGTKGFMVAPFFAIHFIQHLLGEEVLDKEVDIKRFYSRFYQK